MARFQFLLSSSRTQATGALPPAGRFRRVKAVVAAALVASALIGVLLAAVFLGSILAAFLVILVVVVSTIATIKAAIRQARR
jgi:hypothetical protein